MLQLQDIKLNPNNPRTVGDDKLQKLIKSIKEFPKMLELRPIVINEDNIILGGNMRFKALTEIGYTEIPKEWVKQAKDLTEEEVKRFIITDNVGFGEWDWELIKSEWDEVELDKWGLDVPQFDMFDGDIDNFFEEHNNDDKDEEIEELICPHCGKDIYESVEE